MVHEQLQASHDQQGYSVLAWLMSKLDVYHDTEDFHLDVPVAMQYECVAFVCGISVWHLCLAMQY